MCYYIGMILLLEIPKFKNINNKKEDLVYPISILMVISSGSSFFIQEEYMLSKKEMKKQDYSQFCDYDALLEVILKRDEEIENLHYRIRCLERECTTGG